MKPFNNQIGHPEQGQSPASNGYSFFHRIMELIRRRFSSFAHHEQILTNLFKILPKLPACLLILTYKTIRPLLGPASCKFHPTCGAFTIEQLKTQPLYKALFNSAHQIVRCNPFF